MVYASKVNGKQLTLCVSGKLWNRSLVMMDVETESLWSHILGEAMEGELKGARLKSIPADMLTWERWKQLHPKTTVLDMDATRFSVYTSAFYARKPESFVFGAIIQGEPYHASWPFLIKNQLLQIDTPELPALVVAEPKSTVARIFDRRLDGKTLDFKLTENGIRDAGTNSKWDTQGVAVEGELKGKKLEPMVGLMSFTRAWKAFHSKSTAVGKLGKAGER